MKQNTQIILLPPQPDIIQFLQGIALIMGILLLLISFLIISSESIFASAGFLISTLIAFLIYYSADRCKERFIIDKNNYTLTIKKWWNKESIFELDKVKRYMGRITYGPSTLSYRNFEAFLKFKEGNEILIYSNPCIITSFNDVALFLKELSWTTRKPLTIEKYREDYNGKLNVTND